MRKLLIGLAGVVVVLAAVIVIAPSFIDLRSMLAPALQSARTATGREVRVGDVGLSLLPAPVATLKDLRVANIPGAAAPDMLQVKAIEVRVALLPLLSRRVEVESVTIVEPMIHIETLKDGRSSLDFPQTQPGAAASGGGGGGAAAGPGGGGFDISLQNVSVRNGAATIRDAAGGQKTIEAINLAASADSLSGPFKAKGTMRAMGVPANLDLAVARIEPGKPASVNVALDGGGAKAQFAGTVTGGDAAQIAGKVAVTAANLAELAKATSAQGGGLPPLAAQSFTLEGNVKGSAKQIAVSDIVVQLGDMRGSGAFALGLGDRITAQLALNLGRIDLDKLLTQVSTPVPAPAPAPAAAKAEPAKAAAPPPPAAPSPPIPANLVAAIDVGIDGIVYRGQAMQKAKLLVDVVNGVVLLKQLSAQLPAGSNLLVANLPLPLGGQAPAIPDGRIEARSDNLRGLLEWLGTDLSAIPSGRLHKFEMKAGVKSDGQVVQIAGLDATLDSTRLTGGGSMQWRDRPAFGVAAKIDRLNLDAYMPVAGLPARKTQVAQAQTGGATAGAQPAAPATPASPLEAFKVLERFDLNLQTEIGSLTYRDTPIQDLKATVEIVNGRVTVKEATVRDVAGAQAAFNLMADKLSTSPVFSTAFNLRATDAKRFLKFVGYDSPLSAQALGQLTAKGTVAGTADQLKIDTQLDGFGGAAKVVGDLAELTKPAPKVNLNIDASFPEFGPVLGAIAGDKAKQGGNKLGPFALKSQIANSGADSIVLRQTELRAFGGSLDIDGTIGQMASGAPSVDLGMKMSLPSLRPLLTAFNPDPQLMASADKLGALSFAGKAVGNAKKVTLRDAALTGLGGAVKLNGDIVDQGEQLDLTADIQNFTLGPLLAALPGQVITAQGAQQLGALTGRIGLKGPRSNLGVAVANASMAAFGGTMALNGTVSDALDPTRKADLAFDIVNLNAGQLLAAFPASGASPALAQGLQTLNAKGSIKGSTDSPSVTLQPARVQAFGGSASLNGTIAEANTPAAKYDMTADIDMPSLMTVLSAFYKPAQTIQGPVKFQNVKLIGDAKKVLIQNLAGQLGTIGVNGTGSVSFDGPRPKIDLNVNTTGDILIDAFLPADPQQRGDLIEPYWKLLFPDLMPASTGGTQLAQAQGRPLNPRWSREPLGLLKTIKAYDANIGFNGQSLVQGPYRIVNPQMHATIANGAMTVDRLVGALFDGTLSITSKVNAVSQPPTAGIQAQVRNLNIAKAAAAAKAQRTGRKWFLAFGRVELSDGTFDSDLAYQATGSSEAEMVQTLNGTGSLSARNGVLDGFDMKRLSDSMKNIDNALNIVQILGATTQGGQTRFQSITSTNRAQNGLMTSTDLLIKADAMEGRGGYNLDFPSYTMNTQITVVLTDHAKTPPIQISAVGPIDNPQTKTDTAALQQHLLANATRFLFGGQKGGQPGQPAPQGGVQDLLQGVLGGGQQPAPAPAGQPAPQPSQAGGVQDLLKGVLGGQQPAPAPAGQPAPAQQQNPAAILQQLLKPR